MLPVSARWRDAVVRLTRLALLCSLFTALGCPAQPADDYVHPEDDDATGDDDVEDDDSAADDDVTGDDDSAPTDDIDGDGWTGVQGDCDDTDPSIHPGADESLCDGVDSDCDGFGEDAAAVVDGMEFANITAGLGAVQDGGTLQVCPGIHYGQLSIARDMTLTSFSGDPDDTILDGQEAETVVYIGQDVSGVISLLTIQKGLGQPWVAGDYYGGGIMSFASTLTVEGCVFLDNEVADLGGKGGALAHYRGSGTGPSELRVDECRFEGHSASSTDGGQGGGIAVNASNDESMTVELLDSTFVDNNAFHQGGAVWIHGADGSPTHVSLSGCTFEGNQAEIGDAGALNLDRWASLQISDSVFSDNHCGVNGGAVCLNHPTVLQASVTLADTEFDGNVCVGDGDGGALAISGDQHDELSLCLDAVTFTNNETDHNGGALYMGHDASYQIEMTDVDFDSNTAINLGGAVSFTTDGDLDLQMNGGSFTGNQADAAGGALYAYGGHNHSNTYTMSLAGVEVDGNSLSSEDQGALCFSASPVNATLDGCTITSNTGGGAALHAMHEDSTLVSIDTDWGTGAADNTPYDAGILGGATYGTYGANASFTCTGALGCF